MATNAQISTNVELVLFDTNTRPGVIILPSTNTIPGRILTFKNIRNSALTSTITFSTAAAIQTFEDNTTRQIYNDPFGVYSFMAGQDNRWYTIGGTRMNSANISSIVANNINIQNILSTANITTSTLQLEDTVTPSTNTVYLTSSILYYQSQGLVQATQTQSGPQQTELFVWGGTRAPKALIIPTVYYFDPRLIPNLVLWLDATDTRTLVFSSGTNVLTWIDKSGRGFDFTQPTLANQPTYSASGFGNRGSLVFDGIAKYLESRTGLASLFGGLDAPISIFVVVRFTDHTNPITQMIFNIYTGTSTNGWHGIYVDNNANPNKWRYGRRDITSATVIVNSLDNIVSGTNYIHTQIFQRTTVNGYINGVQDVNLSNAPFDVGDLTFTTSIASLGVQIRSNIQYYLNGQIGEILVYQGQVLGNQRLQVEQYLSQKWNIPVAPPFSPTFVPGLSFWLDASQLTGLTNGQTISSWNDISPNAYAGTAVGSPTYNTNLQNGLPGITFNGTSQYINFGDILNLGTSQVFVFAVCKFTNTGSGAIVGKTSFRANIGRWALYRDLGNLTFMIDVTGFGYNTTFADSDSTNTRVFTGYWDRNTAFVMSNGYPTAFNTAGYTTLNMTNTDPLWVGAYPNSTGTAPPQYFFQGQIFEILVYVAPLNYGQRQNIENYLAAKWGVTLNRFSPISISGLHLWLDAASPTTISLPLTGGSNISTWTDRSLSNNNAIQSTEAVQPTYNSSQRVVVFNGTNQFFSINAPAMLRNRPGATIFAVRQYYNLTSDRIIFSVATNSGGLTRSLIGQANSQYRTGGRRLDADSFRFNVRSSATTQMIESYVQDWANANWQIYEFGTVVTSSWSTDTTSGNSSDTDSTGIFVGVSANGVAQFFEGGLNELIVYPSALTTTQRQQVEGYLSWKWGLTLTTAFSPISLTGTQLWLDGADAGTLYSDVAGTTFATVGQTIGYWRDKSGAGRHYTNATAGNRPSYSSASNILFASGSQALSNGVTWNPTTSWDIFFVGRPLTVAGSTNWRTLLRGSNSDHPILVENAATRIGYYNSGAATFYPFGSLTVDGNSTVLGYVNINSSRQYSAALNGTLTLSSAGAVAGTADSQMFFSLGNWNPTTGNQPWGTLNEIIITPNTNTVQRQLMEGYLAWKWGLVANLPSDHPYKNNAPLHPFRNNPP